MIFLSLVVKRKRELGSEGKKEVPGGFCELAYWLMSLKDGIRGKSLLNMITNNFLLVHVPISRAFHGDKNLAPICLNLGQAYDLL